METDRQPKQRFQHRVASLGAIRHDERPLADLGKCGAQPLQFGHRIDTDAIGKHDIRVQVGKIVPIPPPERAEYRHGKHARVSNSRTR